ncbi:Anaphase-promoting complex, cyclosome, subunit 3 [Anatilimnocola aggregata]|uniref:Anaphase-promoting complex, cyclosome, subunit 3 n=1 Tax=Anatilimnocola aggregata TaxID=2528021 RepID=A0A517YDW5_9BACT|nr:CDC27 family protein [Anatilimnocola aggregata]QDU28418.1 Anaphase-promoting complex, cyclosome, subunit 3 [Anatilimnocola aggregata]
MNKNYWPAGLACAGLAILSVTTTGCVPRAKTITETTSTSTGSARSVDELTLGFESLRNLNNPAATERGADGIVSNSSASRAVFYLNQWLARQDIDAFQWQSDPMFEKTPQSIRKHPVFAQLDQLDYTLPDVTYLQQCLWLNDIAQRTTQEPAPAALQPWLQEIEKNGKIEAANQLRQAERLFDWTVRNIQLNPLLPPPKGPQLTAEEAKKSDNRPPPQRGVPGPGYQQLPRQTLLYGEGDSWERGRIFIQLCRQAGIPAVMLGMVRDTELAGPQAWAAAVLVEEELYLFDPQLGIAIPGPNRQGIATLTEFVADESLRTALQPPEGEPYGVTAEDLQNVAALLEAQPETLYRRMAFLEEPINNARAHSRTEQRAEGDDRPRLEIVLAYRPTELEPKLRRVKHISTVGLWRVPFEAVFYSMALPEVVAKQPELAMRLQEREIVLNKEEMVYLGDKQTVDRSLVEGQQQKVRTPRSVTLNQGRDYFLRGRFEDLDGRPGARSVMLSFRPSAQEIELHESSPAYLRAKYGEHVPLPEDPKQRALGLMRMGRMMRSAKNNSTYWLALSYFETGEYANAIEWLDPIVRGEFPDSPWLDGARYITARSYEALGKTDQARELYLADESPQAAGNKLRAEWLKPPVDAAKPEKPTDESEKK